MRGAFWFLFLVTLVFGVSGIGFIASEQGRPELTIMGDAATVCFGAAVVSGSIAALLALAMKINGK